MQTKLFGQRHQETGCCLLVHQGHRRKICLLPHWFQRAALSHRRRSCRCWLGGTEGEDVFVLGRLPKASPPRACRQRPRSALDAQPEPLGKPPSLHWGQGKSRGKVRSAKSETGHRKPQDGFLSPFPCRVLNTFNVSLRRGQLKYKT